jgi:carboxypeptidase T
VKRLVVLGVVAAMLVHRCHHAAPDKRTAVRVEPRSAEERAAVEALSDDVWTDEGAGPLVMTVDPPGLEKLQRTGATFQIVVDDIRAAAATEHDRLAHRTAEFYGDYRDLDELDARMASLAERHPDLARLRTLGTSLEGRPIHALELSHGGTREIFVDGGHHAREWIAVMVPMCVAERLVTDPKTRPLLDSIKFVIAPVINPDGYRYTWTTDRYWRKNRRGDYGVDLNRNYSVAWGEAGSSKDKTSSTYCGAAPFSEPETRAVRHLFETDHVTAAIDFHSFSQVIVYPWSHQRAEPADRDAFAAIADRMTTAMFGTHGTEYEIRPGSSLRTGASGTVGDWAYAHGALSFLIELRPSSMADGGFVVPPDQIEPTCDEGMAAVVALAASIAR